jgi:hypothetical protein
MSKSNEKKRFSMQSSIKDKLSLHANLRWSLAVGVLWIILWVFPWTTWLAFFPWLRLGVAIFIFVIPGFSVSLFLAGDRFTLPSHFISGLAITILFVGLLGVLGRITHLPFTYIKPVFIVIGTGSLFMTAFHARLGRPLYKSKKISTKMFGLLFLIIVFSVVVAFWDRIGLDERVYLVYLTSWQHSPQLDFKDVFFNSGDLTGARFWLAMFPMNLAFLSEISGLHGVLLLGLYLNPVFVAIAILATYNLYDELLQSEEQTIAALTIQITFLFLLIKLRQPGSMFFFRMTEDKVFAGFILGPAFFMAVRILLQSRTLYHSIFVLFIGWSLALTHPIILTYAVFIAGVYAIIITFTERDIKGLIVTITILLAIILPVASLRFVGSPWVSRYIFGLSTPIKQPGRFDLESALNSKNITMRISIIKGTPFYGFELSLVKFQRFSNSNQISVFFSWSYLWILGLGFLWALFNLNKHPAAPLVGAASLLVLLCAIPYTGWLVGKFVSARMLWRAPWLLPIGLSATVLLKEVLVIWKRIIKPKKSLDGIPMGITLMICSVLIIHHSLIPYVKKWEYLPDLPRYKSKLLILSGLGDYLETNIEETSRFVATKELSGFLPGLSSKSKVTYFRNDKRTPNPPNMNAVRSLLSIDDDDVSLEQRFDFLVSYDVQYMLINDVLVKDYYNDYPEYFVVQKYNTYPEIFDVQGTGDLWIIEFTGAGH